MNSHPHVPHPCDRIAESWAKRSAFSRRHDEVLAWLATHVLASRVMFDVALIAPLLVLPGPDSLKITLGVISGSWIQWWGLPAIQRLQAQADRKHDAKMDADHETFTHLAETLDALHAVSLTQDVALARIEARLNT